MYARSLCGAKRLFRNCVAESLSAVQNPCIVLFVWDFYIVFRNFKSSMKFFMLEDVYCDFLCF